MLGDIQIGKSTNRGKKVKFFNTISLSNEWKKNSFGQECKKNILINKILVNYLN